MRILCLFVIAFGFRPVYAQQTPGRKIIDMHLHARPFNYYGNPPAPNPVTRVKPTWKNDAEVVQMTIDTLKKYGVVKAIISGTISRVADFKNADPGRFIPSLDYPAIKEPLPDTSAFIKLYNEGKFLVFGELGLQYVGKTLTDPELAPYLAICERLGIPVGLHTGLSAPNTPYTCCPAFRTTLGNPQLIEEVLIKHPKLKIYLMHFGAPYQAETLAIMSIYPQVYADISVLNWIIPTASFYSYLQYMMDAGFGKRIMYGSDQMGWPDAIGLSIRTIENAPFLTESQKQDIFYNNARVFLNLKD
jgi:predicted TIM-barrel fold metal-dependent hydrolase